MIAWPFFPNWKTPYRETYAYLTEVLVSDSGREQRRAYRVAARRSVEYRSLVSRDRMRAMRRVLARQGEAIIFADERRRGYLVDQVSAGSDTAVLDAAYSWAVPGRAIMFEDRTTRERVVRVISAAAGPNLTLADLSPRAWSDGVRVHPTFVGTMNPNLKATYETSEVGELAVSLDVEPGTEIEIASLAPTLFQGVEVFAHRPNWSAALQIESSDPTEWVDYEIGVRSAYRLIPYGTDIIQAKHVARTEAELNATLGVFMRAKGRRGEFYMPTWLNDIALAKPTTAGSTTWTVAGHDLFDAYFDDTVHRAFAVRLSTGALHYFRVAGITKSAAGAPQSFIQTTTPAPQTFSPDDIERISWMPICRFGSDELTVSWVTDRTAEIVMSVQTLENRT